MPRLLAALATLALVAPAAPARADLFEVAVAGGPSASGASVADLIGALLGQDGSFAGVGARPTYSASLSYLGVEDAIEVTASQNGERVTVTIPSTGYTRTFTGDDPDAVADEVERWLREEGAQALAGFLGAMNAASALALLDGNPRATTAFLAGGAFQRHALQRLPGRTGGERPGLVLRADVGHHAVSAQGYRGLAATDGALTLAGWPGERVGLSFSASAQGRRYAGTRLQDVGGEVALPLAAVAAATPDAAAWTVTPFVHAGLGVSVDAAAGGVVAGGGLASAVVVPLGRAALTVGNQVAFYRGLALRGVRGYTFRTDLRQVLLQHGLKAAWAPHRVVGLDASAALSSFARGGAAVPHYASLAAGLTLRGAGRVGARLAWESDVGRDYRSHGVTLRLAVTP